MSRIDATVTATDNDGNFLLSIDKNPIPVPPGQHDIVFQLVDETSNGPTVFDSGDPIYYHRGNSCPSSGKNCQNLNVKNCDETVLTLGDSNTDSIGEIGYQLNFRYGNKKEQLDPIIINH